MAKYEFIESQALEPGAAPVQKMCCWLEVSRSGFYHWRTRPVSATAARRQQLAGLIKQYFKASDGTYGYRRIHADLVHDAKVECSPELVRQIMRAEGLVPCQPRPFRVTTEADVEAAVRIPDLVKRDFTASQAGRKFVGDITYIHTWQGFVYLATVIDCYSKKVVGWAIDDHMRADLVEQALLNAAASTVIHPGAIYHSDRGSQYASTQFRECITKLGMRSSMGRTGVCWDNAQAETFFSALKNERVYRTVYATKTRARKDVINYIEAFYNLRRRHSGLDYRTPNEVHYSDQQALSAA